MGAMITDNGLTRHMLSPVKESSRSREVVKLITEWDCDHIFGSKQILIEASCFCEPMEFIRKR